MVTNRDEAEGSVEVDQSHDNLPTPPSPAAPGSPMKENRAPPAVSKLNKVQGENEGIDKSAENTGGISSTSRIGDSKVTICES